MAHSQRLQPRARVTSGWSFAAAVGLSTLLVTTPNSVQAPSSARWPDSWSCVASWRNSAIDKRLNLNRLNAGFGDIPEQWRRLPSRNLRVYDSLWSSL
jgi:hypothetical protein